MEGLIASSPVSPVLVVVGVLAVALLMVIVYPFMVIVYPYVNDRWQSLKTFGVWPPAKGSLAHRMAQRRVQRTIGTLTQEIDQAEATIAGIEQFWVNSPDQPDMLADIAKADRLQEDKERLTQKLLAACRLAKKFGFQEPSAVPTGQTQNGTPKSTLPATFKELVVTSKSS